MKNLAKAVINVMQAVKGIEKSSTIGRGNSQYKGVSDYEVKKIYSEAMTKNGLCILPTEIIPQTKITNWEEETNYGLKQKQSVFTQVSTKYLLLHDSGESMELAGYGQGVDSQDKGAGKATTYALKYALLYTFLTPTGKIDDADATHSNDQPAPQVKTKKNLSLKDYKTAKETFNKEQLSLLLVNYNLTDQQRKEITIIKDKK